MRARRGPCSARDLVPGPRLILATGNPHKLEELRRILPGLDVDALGRDDPPPEDGESFEDNARIKARFAQASGSARTPASRRLRSTAGPASTRPVGRRVTRSGGCSPRSTAVPIGPRATSA